MNNIKTYDDLLAEEKRLAALLYSHKEAIKTSFAATKQSLNPFRAAMDTARNLFTRSKTNPNPLMKFGVDFGIDVFFKRILLAKAGWFTKIVLPFVLKNYSTHILREGRPMSVLSKIVGIFKGRKSNIRSESIKLKTEVKEPFEMIDHSVQSTGANYNDVIDIQDTPAKPI